MAKNAGGRASKPNKTVKRRVAPPNAYSKSAKSFANIVNDIRARGSGVFPLVDITFFLGAGFSKSWDTHYPTGPQLFEVPGVDRKHLFYAARAAGADIDQFDLESLDMDWVMQAVYGLDMNAKFPAIRSRYVDRHNIDRSRRDFRTYFANRFRQLVAHDWKWIVPPDHKFAEPVNYSPEQDDIRRLFSYAFNLIDGSHGQMQGARFNFITTNYDWLVERIIDSVVSEDDSAFLYLYRGITPDEFCGDEPPILAFAHSLVFNLLKINGGIEIIRDGTGYRIDYRQRDFAASPPILMLPSREQDYTDDYFLAIFPKAVRLLNESKILVLVGYSLPQADALLRFIIRQFCEDEADSLSKALFYVDMAPEADQLARLQSVFPFAGKTLHTETFSGSFAAWAKEVADLLK